MRRRLGIFAVIGATLAALAVGGIGVLSASGQANNDKVTLCHRRAAVTNPYGPKAITVDQSAVFNNGIVPNGHGTHTGPIFPATGPDGKWGDIIPPFDGYPGQNWPAGEAILLNGCQIPGPPPTSGPPETTAKPPETTAKPPETTAKPPETTAKPPETTAKPTQPTQPPQRPAAPSAPVPVAGQPVFTG